MMAPKRARAGVPQHLRVAERQAIGPLRRIRVSPKTYARYLHAATLFLQYLTAMCMAPAASYHELDDQAIAYLEHLWEEGEPKSLAADTLSAVQHFLIKRRILSGAWALYGAWSRVELPDQAPPLPVLHLWAFCGLALQRHGPRLAATLAVGFHCMLRTVEMLTLRFVQIALGQAHTGVVALPLTKSGQRRGAQEMVTMDDPILGRLLATLAADHQASDLLCNVAEAAVRHFFEVANATFGLPLRYRPYSLRRGGATHDYLAHANLGKTVLRGRWGSLATARVYINDGLSVLSQIIVEPRSALLLQEYAERFCAYLRAL